MATFNFPDATGDQLGDPTTGRGSFLLFGEQGGKFNNRVIDLDDFYTLKEGIINTSLQINSPQLNVATIPIGRAPFPGQAGPVDVQGSFNVTGALRFSEIFWRNLINTKEVEIVPNPTTIADSPFTPGAGSQALFAAASLPGTAGDRASAGGTITGLTQPTGGVPIRVNITLSAAASGTTVTIFGTNFFDEQIRETVSGFESGSLTHATNNWFKTITDWTSTAATGTIKLDRYNEPSSSDSGVYDDGGRWTNLRLLASSQLLNGLTIVQVIGGETGSIDTFFDCWLQSVNFRFAREEVVAEEWTVVGRNGLLTVGPDGVEGTSTFVPKLQRRVDSTTGRLVDDIRSPAVATPTPTRIFRDSDIRGISGWQTSVTFRNNGTTTPINLAVIDGTATVNANTNFVPRTGSRPPGSAFQRTAESTVQLTMEYHEDYEPLVQAQLSNRTFENVRLEMTALTETGFPAQRFITFNQLELTESPTRNVDGDNFVSLSISGRALPSTPSATDDVRVDLKVPGTNVTGANGYQAWAGNMAADTTPTNGRLRVYS